MLSVLCSFILTVTVSAVNFEYTIHKPYDIDVNERFVIVDDIYHFLVYDDDKPFVENSTTHPRTEMRILNDYRAGIHSFVGDMYILEGTNGASVFQIFGGSISSTAMSIRVRNNNLIVDDDPNLEFSFNVTGKWLRLYVNHVVDTAVITVTINGVDSVSFPDRGAPVNSPSGFYFKLGVYAQSGASFEMRSQFKNMYVFDSFVPTSTPTASFQSGAHL